jgi:hypothetical protein
VLALPIVSSAWKFAPEPKFLENYVKSFDKERISRAYSPTCDAKFQRFHDSSLKSKT